MKALGLLVIDFVSGVSEAIIVDLDGKFFARKLSLFYICSDRKVLAWGQRVRPARSPAFAPSSLDALDRADEQQMPSHVMAA